MNITTWLRQLSLQQYTEVFDANAIDDSVLFNLTDADLKELGVSALGHRKKLLAAIAALAEDANTAPSPVAPNTSAERRQLTVMFVDLVGSTALANALDPEDLRALIRDYQNVATGEVSRFGGHVAQFLGDGVLAYFGWPQAHEDNAERAVRAALGITAALLWGAGKGTPLKVRIGIATGQVVVGDLIGEGSGQRETAIGETPNLAARLQALAEPGAILINESTHQLVGDVFELETIAAQAVKGFSTPLTVYRIKGERTVESRFAAHQLRGLSPLIGRDEELAWLKARWQRALQGEGQLVLLSGEAGIGKSRLTEALIEDVRNTPHYLLRYQCSPYHADSALYPVIQQLRHAAAFIPDESTEQRLNKLEKLLALGSTGPHKSVPLIAELLGVSGEARYGTLTFTPQQRREQTLACLVDQLLGLSAEQPVLWLLEDAHWIDPTTLELIELCLDRISRASVSMLITTRPGFVAPFASHAVVSQLALSRLPREAMRRLMLTQTGGKSLPEELQERLMAQTDGIPLFVEEVTRSVIESGALVENATGYVLSKPLDVVAVPATLQDSLMARLDRLPVAKIIAQTASVIGRSFDYPTLASLIDETVESIDVALKQLVEGELIFSRGSPSQATYIFKHALLRDSAYESLLKARRASLHTKLVEVLVSQGNEDFDVLAQHAQAAGLTERALDYWERAITQALAVPALKEALVRIANALKLCEKLGDDVRWKRRAQALYVQRAQSLIPIVGYTAEETIEAFDHARMLADELGDIQLQLPATYGIWPYAYVAGKPFRDITHRFSLLAARQSENGPQLVATRLNAMVAFHDGEFSEAVTLFTRAIEQFDPGRDRELVLRYGQDNRVAAASYLAVSQWLLGSPARALQTAAQAFAWARPLNHVNTTLYTLALGRLLVSLLRRDKDEAFITSHEIMRLSEQYGARNYIGWAQNALMWATSDQTLAAGFDDHTTFGRWLPWTWSQVAETFLVGRNLVAAKCSIDAAIDWLSRSDDVAFAAEVYRRRAQVYLACDSAHRAMAIDDLMRAIEIAKQQKALGWELRAARDLARVWGESGERQRAVDLLAPVYAAFTEGFDTRDLIESASLLDTLTH